MKSCTHRAQYSLTRTVHTTSPASSEWSYLWVIVAVGEGEINNQSNVPSSLVKELQHLSGSESDTAENTGETKVWLNMCSICGVLFFDGDPSQYLGIVSTPFSRLACVELL